MVRTLLVSFNDCDGMAEPILMIGDKKPGQPAEIINAYQGEAAMMLYDALITKKEDKEESQSC